MQSTVDIRGHKLDGIPPSRCSNRTPNEIGPGERTCTYVVRRQMVYSHLQLLLWHAGKFSIRPRATHPRFARGQSLVRLKEIGAVNRVRTCVGLLGRKVPDCLGYDRENRVWFYDIV